MAFLRRRRWHAGAASVRAVGEPVKVRLQKLIASATRKTKKKLKHRSGIQVLRLDYRFRKGSISKISLSAPDKGRNFRPQKEGGHESANRQLEQQFAAEPFSPNYNLSSATNCECRYHLNPA